MTGGVTLGGPDRVAPWQRLGYRLMDIFLHVGAHRTATTSFQHYLHANTRPIKALGVSVWGPRQVRNGLFSGIFPKYRAAPNPASVKRACGRVSLQLAKISDAGTSKLLVSEENMIGSARQCVHNAMLYPAIGERMARFDEVFGHRVKRVMLTMRSPDMWWSSAIGYTVSRGHTVPDDAAIGSIAASPRSWRDVITDLACALPDTKIQVSTFEEYAARPDALFARITDEPAPPNTQTFWRNRTPDLTALRRLLAEYGKPQNPLPQTTSGRWQPFTDAQTHAMRESYADDLFWLAAGADGLATLTVDPTRKRAGASQPPGELKKGHDNDSRQRKLA